MKLSLIIGTLNRKESIMTCLESLLRQDYEDYEIIIVDQSDNDDTETAIKSIDNDKIRYYHVNYRGLSRARNEALRKMTGDCFCLIDDDAYYSENYLSVAAGNARQKTVLSGRIFDTVKQKDFASYNGKYSGKTLPTRMVLRTCPSAALVLPGSIIEDAGYFDEKFGVGSVYCAGEETDLLLRAMNAGYKIMYVPELQIKHPYPITAETGKASKKGNYYEGIGALYKKHKKDIKIKPTFFEIWIKFFIKQIIYRGEKRTNNRNNMKSFIYGYKSYRE